MLTKLMIDRGISFNALVQTIVDENAASKEDNEEAMPVDEAEENDEQRPSGFYISRRKIAGRHLVAFAQRKLEMEDSIDRDFIDPLNLMFITRPNTGKNPCEMPSQELNYKYRLLISSSDLLKHIRSSNIGELSDADGEEKSEKDTAQPIING